MAEVLTAVSILVALATWFFTHRRAVEAERIQLTGQLISHFSTNPILDAANARFSRMVLQGASLNDDQIPEDIDRDLIRILNYYEFLCNFCELRALDEKTIKQLRGIPILQSYEAAKGYIDARRKRLNYPALYGCLERMAENIRKENS